MARDPVLQTIIGDAAWLCHRYDPQYDAFQYRRVERSRHRTVPFLTDSCLGAVERPATVTLADAIPFTPSPAPLHFIFHSAFCASTMLTRALDLEGSAMGLSEPVVLNDIVGWRRRGAEPRQSGSVLAAALGQLARPWGPGEAVVVKPSNVFNGLAAGALMLSPQSRGVLLTAPLPVFLASVARKGLDCRLWVRELLEGLVEEGMVDLGFEPRDYFRQTDLQVAAVGWLAQQMLFMRMIERFPERLVSLDSERLTDDPAASVAGVARFLGLGRSDEADYRDHPALSRDSKSGAAFGSGQRRRDREMAEQAHGDEIAKVVAWATAVADNACIPMTLPSALR